MDERRHRRMRERALIAATLSLLLLVGGDLSSAKTNHPPRRLRLPESTFPAAYACAQRCGTRSINCRRAQLYVLCFATATKL